MRLQSVADGRIDAPPQVIVFPARRADPRETPCVWLDAGEVVGWGLRPAPGTRFGVLPLGELAAALAACGWERLVRQVRADATPGGVDQTGVCEQVLERIRPSSGGGAVAAATRAPGASAAERLAARRAFVSEPRQLLDFLLGLAADTSHPIVLATADDALGRVMGRRPRPDQPPWRVLPLDPKDLLIRPNGQLRPVQTLRRALLDPVSVQRLRALEAPAPPARRALALAVGERVEGEGYWSRVAVRRVGPQGSETAAWEVAVALGGPFLMRLPGRADAILWKGPFEVVARLRRDTAWQGPTALPIDVRRVHGPARPPEDSAIEFHPYVHELYRSPCLGQYRSWAQANGGDGEPALDLLEHLKAAARTLRYGFHARNEQMPHHRPLDVLTACGALGHPIPYVVVPGEQLDATARALGAEIVPYARPPLAARDPAASAP
jgi:hypothetical protein